MFKNKSLSFKLSFSVISCMVIILAVIALNSYFTIKKIIMKDVEDNAKNLSEATANKIDQIFLAASEMTKAIAVFLETSDPDEKKIHLLMREMLKKNPEVFGTCVAFEPGEFKKGLKRYAPYCWRNEDKIDFTNLDNESYKYELWDWYQIAKETRKPVWMEPYYDDGGGNIIMSTYSLPFYKKTETGKKLAGVVTVDISLSWLQKLMSSIKTIKKGYGFIISKHGTIVTHPDMHLVMNETIFSISEGRNFPGLRETGRNMINGKSGLVPHTCLLYNRKCWLYYTPLTSNGWSLGVVFPEKELLAPLTKLNNTIIFISVVGLALIFIVIIYISHKITKPLRKLASATKSIGAGNFNTPIPDLKTGDEIGALGKSFSRMQKELTEYIENLKNTTAAKERIESELNIARDIQRSIIPMLFPAFPERKEFEIYALLESAKAVGGDLYDFFFIDDNHLYFAVGDVSGKGVPASLFMAVTQTLSRAKADSGFTAGQIVTGINKDLCRSNEMSMFVTYFACILNIHTGKLEYSNAGHNPPYLMKADGTVMKMANKHGMALGVMDMGDYGCDEIRLTPGDRLVLYTDGVTEAMDTENNEYTDPRLQELLEKIQPEKKNAEKLVNAINEDVKKFTEGAEQSDDITILVLHIRGTEK